MTAAYALPDVPLGATVTARQVRYGGQLIPPLGGPIQQITRLGTRFAVDVQIPALETACAETWLAARLRAEAEGAKLYIRWPQPKGGPLTGVVPTVRGAGQTGTTLTIGGLTAGATIPPGKWFSWPDSTGRGRLQMTTSSVTADGAGHATLTIAPMLRVSPPDSVGCDFSAPTIQGFLDAGNIEWTIQLLTWTGMSFTLTEDA